MTLLAFYALVLTAGAWPRLLSGGHVTSLQLASLWLLSEVGVFPGQEVFNGRQAPRTVPRLICFRISAVEEPGAGRGPEALYDDLGDCENGQVDLIKDSFAAYQRRMLWLALRHARTPSAHKDLNQYPLSYLLAFTEYYCHLPNRESPHAIHIVSYYDEVNYDTGQKHFRLIEEGFRPCTAPRWVQSSRILEEGGML